MTDNKDFDLETYFAAERDVTSQPSVELMARIMADSRTHAQTHSPAARAALTPRPAVRRGMFASLLDAVGGWPSLAGMATATVAGVWIGFSQPAGLDLVADQLLGTSDTTYLVDLVPAFYTEFEEG